MNKIKVLLSSLVAVTLFVGTAAEAVYNSFIYITNETNQTIVRETVTKETGQKIAPAFKTKVGYRKKGLKVEGMTCTRFKCTAEKRIALPNSVEQGAVTRSILEIEPGKTVRITKISRDQPSLKMVNWSKVLPGYKNPDLKRFRPTLLSKVYPYEQIATTLKGPAGKIGLLLTSERVGLANLFLKSAALTVAPVVAGTAVVAGGVAATTGVALGIYLTVAPPAAIGPVIFVAVSGVGASLIGGGVLSQLALAGAVVGIPLLIGLDQRSGLLTEVFGTGDYKVTQKTKLRFGNIYKDVYITISSREKP